MNALQDLLNKIAPIAIQSRSSLSTSQNNSNFSQKFEDYIQTYAYTSLPVTSEIIVKDEPNAIVLKYIKQSELHKIFEQRLDLIKDYIKMANKFKEGFDPGNALKYYDWANVLLKSHPDCNSIKNETSGEMLISWLPNQINEILQKTKFVAGQVTDEKDLRRVIIYATYDNKPAATLDFKYLESGNYTNPVSMKDGIAQVEFYGPLASSYNEILIACDYLYYSEAISNKEMKAVLESVEPFETKNAHYSVRLGLKENEKAKAVEKAVEAPAPKISASIDDASKYTDKLSEVIKAIKSKNYESVRQYFTTNGFNVFDSLVHYGNAVVLQERELKAFSFSGGTMVRSVPMSFSFANNKKRFSENVVFYFNNQSLIDNVTFGLAKSAVDGISSRPWSDNDKLTIVNFLENYKTAYALKRLNYIEQLFSENALIIVGNVIKVYDKETKLSKSIVQKNKLTKKEYIKNLKNTFSANEFINLKFEESDVLSSICDGRRFYGIQLRQIYTSSNYGDEGYLFLLVDMQNPEMPIIHVRTWQPQKDYSVDGISGLYGFGNFNCN